MKKQIAVLISILSLFLLSSTFVAAACTQPPVSTCNSDCAHLPSYPTYEKEACIEACVEADYQAWVDYQNCLDTESEQASEEQQETQQEQTQEEDEGPSQDELDAQREFEEQLAKETAEKEQEELEAAEDEAAKIGSISLPEGTVEVLKADGSRRQLGDGDDIRAGDVILTRKGSSVTLVFDSGDVNLGQNAIFEVDKMDAEEKSFTLSAGRVWAYIQKAIKSRHTIRTPTAAVAVRGTEFILEYDEETETSALHLYEGEVEYTTESGTEIIYAGESVVTQSGTSEYSELTQDLDEWYVFVDQAIYDPESESSTTLTQTSSNGGGTSLLIYAALFAVGAGIIIYGMKRKKKKSKK